MERSGAVVTATPDTYGFGGTGSCCMLVYLISMQLHAVLLSEVDVYLIAECFYCFI